MSTITRELAKLFRKITNSEIDAEGNAHVVLSPADSLLINNARIALASLEAEPVGTFKKCPCGYYPSFHEDAVPLYAAPQPATAVLDASVMADNHISWLNENFPRKTFTDEEWVESFEEFFKYVGPRPDGYSLDRIDTNGNYEPGNIRWVTNRSQQNNKRNTVFVMFDGQKISASEYARAVGMKPDTVHARIRRGLKLDGAIICK